MRANGFPAGSVNQDPNFIRGGGDIFDSPLRNYKKTTTFARDIHPQSAKVRRGLVGMRIKALKSYLQNRSEQREIRGVGVPKKLLFFPKGARKRI